MLAKLFLPAVFAAGFFVYTHPPSHHHVSAAYVAQACDSAGSVSATFAWPPPPANAQQVWLDVGVDAGFTLGWYQGHGSLPPSQQTFEIGGLAQGVTYHYRVNALTGDGFKLVAKGSLVATCAPAPAAPEPAADRSDAPAQVSPADDAPHPDAPVEDLISVGESEG